MKSVVSNRSQTSLAPSTLLGSSLAVVQEILAVKWPNPGAKFHELDRLDEEIQQELHQARQAYSESANKKNRVRLLQALQTKMEALNKEYQQAVTLQRVYAEKADLEAKHSKSIGWGEWVLRVMQRVAGSDSLQRQEYYASIAKNRLEKLDSFSDDWQQLYNKHIGKKLSGEKIKPNHLLAQTINNDAGGTLEEENRQSKKNQLLDFQLVDVDCESTFKFDKQDTTYQVSQLIPTDWPVSTVTSYYPVYYSGKNGVINKYSSRGNKSNPFVVSFYIDNSNSPGQKNYLIAWDERNGPGGGNGSDIYLNIDPNNPINWNTEGDQSYPVMSVFDNDQFIIAWHSANNQTEPDYDVYALCYNQTLDASRTQEVRVNNQTVGNQSYPAVSTWGNSFVIAWENDIEGIDSSYSVKAQFFTTTGTDSGFECNWYQKEDILVVSSAIGRTENTGIGVVAVEDTTLVENGKFLIVWVGGDQNIYVRPFSVTGIPLRSPYLVSSSGNLIKIPSGLTIGNLFNGNVIFAWNPIIELQVASCNGTYTNEYNTSDSFQEDYDLYQEDDNIHSRIMSVGGSAIQFGFSSGPETPVATSPNYNETFPMAGTFLGGNFIIVWRASSNIITPSSLCHSGLYGQFYQQDGTPLHQLYCVYNPSTTQSYSYGKINMTFNYITPDPGFLNINTLVNGDFVLAWSDWVNFTYTFNGTTNSTSIKDIYYLYYSNQAPTFNQSYAKQNGHYDRLDISYGLDTAYGKMNISSLLIAGQAESGDIFKINLNSYFTPDPEGATVTYTINIVNRFIPQNNGKNNGTNQTVGQIPVSVSNTLSPALSTQLPPAFTFDSSAGVLTITYQGESINNLTMVSASDPYGMGNSFYARVKIDPKSSDEGTWEQAKKVLSAFGSISGAFLAIWAYMWNQYRLKKYREFQHPFASEIHECLNLSYSDFSSDPGKEYAAIVSLMLQTMREKTGRDIQKLRTAKESDNRLLYHYYAFLFAKAILNLSGSMELLRNTAICGMELKGPFASREILLSDFKAEADNIVEDVISLAQNSEVPTEWKQAFEEQQVSVEEEKSSTACRDRMHRICCPLQDSATYRMFQTRKLMTRALSGSQHDVTFSGEAKFPRGLSSSSPMSTEPKRRLSSSNLFAEFEKTNEQPENSGGIELSGGNASKDTGFVATV